MLKELFSQYKDLLTKKGVQVKFSEETKMTSAKLVSGDEVSTTAESWAEGVDVTGADGQPLATGEYQLETGETLVVTDGKVTTILPAGYKETEMSAEEVAEGLEIIATEQKAQIDALESEKQTLEATVTEKENELQKANTQIAEMKAQIAKFSKAPAATSVKKEREVKAEEPLTRGQQLFEKHKMRKEVFSNQK